MRVRNVENETMRVSIYKFQRNDTLYIYNIYIYYT